jgi:hypothetical protein
MTPAASLERIRALTTAVVARAPHLGPLAGQPVSEGELADFEARQGACLPDGYRAFILAFGDGALVPQVIHKRARLLEEHPHDPVWRSFAGPMAGVFPHSGTTPIALPWDDAADDYVRQDAMRGTLCLGSAGCDVIRILVVTGPARGTVWTFVPGLDTELHPSGLMFLEWCVAGWEQALADLGGRSPTPGD